MRFRTEVQLFNASVRGVCGLASTGCAEKKGGSDMTGLTNILYNGTSVMLHVQLVL